MLAIIRVVVLQAERRGTEMEGVNRATATSPGAVTTPSQRCQHSTPTPTLMSQKALMLPTGRLVMLELELKGGRALADASIRIDAPMFDAESSPADTVSDSTAESITPLSVVGNRVRE